MEATQWCSLHVHIQATQEILPAHLSPVVSQLNPLCLSREFIPLPQSGGAEDKAHLPHHHLLIQGVMTGEFRYQEQWGPQANTSCTLPVNNLLFHGGEMGDVQALWLC